MEANIATLVGKTIPVIEGINTLEEFIVHTARVSNPSNQLNNETAPNLIRYLLKNQHFSPFEMASMTIKINTTRDIARQILRHRSFSFQEFSTRYAVVDSKNIVLREARLQDSKNRQNSFETNNIELQEWFDFAQAITAKEAFELYNTAIEKGIAKEQARALLPEGITPSTLYMSGTIRSWITYIILREKNGTQKEHKKIALACKEILKQELPNVHEALTNTNNEWML